MSSVLAAIGNSEVISITIVNMANYLSLSFVVLQLAFLSYGFEIQPRVINGIPSATDEFPFYVKLVVSGTSKFCGGTLISDR